MSLFVDNPVDFSADCACRGGRCRIARENFLFLDAAPEFAAIDRLQDACGCVVITAAPAGRAWLYHTSCPRMTDVVEQVFAASLAAPERLPQSRAEMTLGEMHRRRVALSVDACRARVGGFDFGGAA